ncbi:hypothetical protein COB18_02915 [Candidatus Kaiserbacteria bacterium]|nr:MAG: hypothetical protein COB18_02915 [Candidatus Kaiserbacteria bacterium]
MSFILRTFIVAALLVFAASPLTVDAQDVSDLVGAQGCSVIDLNWKEYGENIRGANTKVSDVVLNACAAIGGKGACTFISGCRYNEGDANQSNPICTLNTGAVDSQHRRSNAIDVVVTPGKEKEFITLAICGLRRVNKCEGGIGFYKSKSIHIDVRTGTTVWSTGFNRKDIALNVSDPEARDLLYGFGDGECVTGSIAGDESEVDIHGPIEEYVPPDNFPQAWKPVLQPSSGYQDYNILESSLKSSLYTSFFQSFGSQSQTIGDGGAFSPLLPISYTSPDTVFDEVIDDGGVYDFETTNETVEQTGTETTRATCEGSGLFGINLFSTCGSDSLINTGTTQNVNISADGEQQDITANELIYITETQDETPSFLQSILNAVSFGGSNDVRTGEAVDVFYDVHIPTDTETGVTSQGSNFENYGQFVAGEAVDVTPPETPDIIGGSARFTGQSILWGSYFGLVHGISPLILGSAPRAFFRFGQ